MLSIYQKEIAAFFNGLTGYLTAGLFLLVTGLLLWVFPDSAITEYGEASLEGFFNLTPYIFMFLIPAVTMQSIAAERSSGTLELLLTRPVTSMQLLTGKFLGSFSIMLITLLPTLLYFYSVYELGAPRGNVDTGAVAGSYCGLLLLGAAFTAIGICMSALSPNVIVSFLLAVFSCYFFYNGFTALAELPVFGAGAYFIGILGMDGHYEAMGRGVMETRDLVYFLSVIVFFLVVAGLLLPGRPRIFKLTALQMPVLLLLLFVLNYVASAYSGRIDFTAEKRYTLAGVSRQAVAHLPDDLHVTVFLTGDLPAGFRRLNQAATDLLTDLKGAAGGKLRFSFVNPLSGDAQEQYRQALAEKGIAPTNLSVRKEQGMMQQLIYPAALVSSGDTEVPVNLLLDRMGASPDEVLNNSIQNLEYAFTSAIRKATAGGKPLVGFTEGHGELSDTALYDLMFSLADGYQAGRVDLNTFTAEGLRNLKVLVVPKPLRAFTEAEKYKLDYFVQHGGRVLWAIDQTNAALDSLRHGGGQLFTANRLNLDDLLFKYGLRFNYDLLADMNCAQIPLTLSGASGPQVQLAPWLFYPVFMPLSAHPIVKNLDGIRSEFAGTLDTIAVGGIKKTILLSSSPYNERSEVPALVSLQLIGREPGLERERTALKPVAALLEGRFPAIFANRPRPAGIPDSLQMPARSEHSVMLAIADGDVLKNQVNQQDGSPYPLGWDRYTNKQYGNKTFIRNAIDYLAGDAAVISLRQKEIKLRLLDRVRVKSEKLKWQFMNVGLPPVLFFLWGITRFIQRKKKYGNKSS